MEIGDIRKAINRGLKPPLSDRELGFLLGEERYAEAFNGEVEDYDIEMARTTVSNLRRTHGMRVEPRSAAVNDAERRSVGGGGSGSVSVDATPSDRVWAAVAALQASNPRVVVAYRTRHLRRGLLPPEEVPEFLRLQSDVSMPLMQWALRSLLRSEVPAGAPVLYDHVAYWPAKPGSLRALSDVLLGLRLRYGWDDETSLRLVLCGELPATSLSRFCLLEETPVDLAREEETRAAFVLRVPVYLTGDEVAKLYTQAREWYRVPECRFTKKAAEKVLFAVERMLRGERLAAIAREWSADISKAGAFRTGVYRALKRVGDRLGAPAVHGRVKRKSEGRPA